MGIPKAVASSVRSPGLFLLVNLLSGPSSPGSAPLKGLLIGEKSSVGSITADTELIEVVSGADEVATLLGPGMPGHLAAKALFTEYPLAQVDVVAPLEATGNAATQTVVFDDSTAVTVSQTVTVTIMGRPVQFVWEAGETDTDAATAFCAAVNAQNYDLPLTAANAGGTSPTATLTFKVKGKIGNDVLLYLKVEDGVGGSVSLTGATLAGGSTEPTISNVLTLVEGKEYDFILLCCSNEEAGNSSTTSNPGLLKTHIDGLDQGSNAKLQQAVIGATSTLALLQVGSAIRNFTRMQYIFCNAGQSLGCEWGGAEMGRRMRMEALDPTVNAIGYVYQTPLYGAADLVADTLTGPEVEEALNTGITPIVYTGANEPQLSRPITTYYKDTTSAPDGRVLDVSRVSGIYAGAKDLRVSIPREFGPQDGAGGAKISPDLEPGDDELPPGVVEIRDVKAFVISRAQLLVSRGWWRQDRLTTAIETGQLTVEIDPDDDSQVNIVLPGSIVPPLAKFSVVVQGTH